MPVQAGLDTKLNVNYLHYKLRCMPAICASLAANIRDTFYNGPAIFVLIRVVRVLRVEGIAGIYAAPARIKRKPSSKTKSQENIKRNKASRETLEAKCQGKQFRQNKTSSKTKH